MPTVKVLQILPIGGGFYALPPVSSGVYSSNENISPQFGVDVYVASDVDDLLASHHKKIDSLEKRLLELETRLSS
jgi:hypothetical protein